MIVDDHCYWLKTCDIRPYLLTINDESYWPNIVIRSRNDWWSMILLTVFLHCETVLMNRLKLVVMTVWRNLLLWLWSAERCCYLPITHYTDVVGDSDNIPVFCVYYWAYCNRHCCSVIQLLLLFWCPGGDIVVEYCGGGNCSDPIVIDIVVFCVVVWTRNFVTDDREQLYDLSILTLRGRRRSEDCDLTCAQWRDIVCQYLKVFCVLMTEEG